MILSATPSAIAVVRRVRDGNPGAALVFVVGSGCCEGLAPHLFADYVLTPEHASVGEVDGVTVVADGHVRSVCADRTLVLDAEEDRAADGFSAEIPLGWRFVLRAPALPAAGGKADPDESASVPAKNPS